MSQTEIMDALALGFVASAMNKVVFERKGLNSILNSGTAMDAVKFAASTFIYKTAVRPIISNAVGINLPKV